MQCVCHPSSVDGERSTVYDLTLVGPGGRAEYEVTVDFRPEGARKPF